MDFKDFAIKIHKNKRNDWILSSTILVSYILIEFWIGLELVSDSTTYRFCSGALLRSHFCLAFLLIFARFYLIPSFILFLLIRFLPTEVLCRGITWVPVFSRLILVLLPVFAGFLFSLKAFGVDISLMGIAEIIISCICVVSAIHTVFKLLAPVKLE